MSDIEKVKKHELSNVSFPPTISKNQVSDFLQKVDICYDAFVSKLSKYGLSRNKWIDYMNAAKPIVCSFNGYESLINQAKCGTFVDYNNNKKLVETILYYKNMDKTLLKKIGYNGKKFIWENNTFDCLAEKYLSNIRSHCFDAPENNDQ